MKLTVSDIANATKAHVYGKKNRSISNVIIDSRSLVDPDGTMFCAIPTESSDGHKFILELYRRGVRVFLVQYIPLEPSANIPNNATFIVVESVFAAIESIAKYCRSKINATMIGITGSAGKTVVKEMLYQSLIGSRAVARSPRSWNSRLGVPLSIIELPENADVAIIECGIDRPGDMQAIEEIVRPDICILTSITDEHAAGFDSKIQKINEKLLLAANAKCLIYNGTDPDVKRCVEQMHRDGKNLCISTCEDANAVNLATTRATLQELGFSKADSENITNGLEPATNRILVHEGVNDCVMLYDGFTADLRSLCAALDFMRRRATATRKNTIILSDLIHEPLSDEKLYDLYYEVASLLSKYGIERVLAIGSEISKFGRAIGNVTDLEIVESSDSFLANYDINGFSSETILIFVNPAKAGRAVKDLLESPRHDSIFEINLDSVIKNFNYYRSLLKPSTGLVAMVKASAYGTGALEISKTLQAQGASYLAVAVIDEGVELRRGGISMPIMVLNPITSNYKALFDYNLEPSVFSMAELDTLISEAKRHHRTSVGVHIKLDTGMHRVGFIERELPALVECLKSCNNIKVTSIFSHLATADCLDKDDYTTYQLDNYARMSSYIVEAMPYPIKRHVLNTAGIMRFPEHQYDMVRLGIGLYGISPLPHEEGLLSTVASLKSTIISLKHWPAGTTIGYGRRGLLHRDSVIATIPIGYADGINRHFGNGATSYIIDDVACPTVGNICMDQCMVDVTDVANPTIGMPVEIFGTHRPVEKLAEILDTIPYEILTSVSPRVRRLYYRD